MSSMKMPVSPSKHRKALDQHISLNHDRLRIRIVPYSPPRLSTDGLASSCAVPCAVLCAVCSPSAWPSIKDQTHDGGCNVAYSPNRRAQPSRQPPLGTDLKCKDGVNTNIAIEFANDTNLQSDSVVDVPDPLFAPVSSSPSYCRANRVISVNPDKTFSLLPQTNPPSTTDPKRSSRRPSSSTQRTISDSCAEEQPRPPIRTFQELSQPCPEDCTPTPLPSSKSQFQESSSPWNYQLIGGLRKVPKDASHKTVHVFRDAAFLASSCSRHEWTACGLSRSEPCQAGNFTSKQLFHSYQSTSTLSEEMNHKTFSHDSPFPTQAKRSIMFDAVDPEQMSTTSTQPNVEVLGETSSEQTLDDRSLPGSSGSNCNYVTHQDLTSSSPAVLSSASPLKTEYYRESLMVAPLRPGKMYHANRANISRQRSRDSTRTGSPTSISSISTDDISGTYTILIPSGVFRQPSTPAGFCISPSSYAEPAHDPLSAVPSTAVSESKRGSEVPSSRLSRSISGDLHSEHASYDHKLCPGLDFRLLNTWIDRPQPAYFRNWTAEANSSTLRLIRDQDEHGDGLAELGTLRRHISSTKLHSHLTNFPPDRNLRSAGSSRSIGFSRSYIPTWARLYYGSGERRLSIRKSSDSLCSNFSTCAHLGPIMCRSASFQISNPAKQTYCHRKHSSAPVYPRSPTMSKANLNDGIPMPCRQLSMIRRIRKQTSSIWSPHLRRDKRANVYSMWRPPSIVFARRESLFFRGRIQTVLFVLGFVFPLAWMAASFLPLPSCHGTDLKGKIHSARHLDLEQGISIQKISEVRASCRDREKWWRTLNRYMSIIGIFITGAVLALTITGTQQQ